MNTSWRKPQPAMTKDDFLAWPGDGTGRTYQLVDGEVRAVSPGSTTHAAIQANLVYWLVGAARTGGSGLRVVTEGAINPGLNAATNVRVPDVAVTAAPDQRGEQVVSDPILIVEILSPGNQDDTRDNIRAYATLPSVQEMAVLSSTRLQAEVHRRDEGGAWRADPEVIGAGERLRLASIGLDIPLVEAYAGTYLAPGRSDAP